MPRRTHRGGHGRTVWENLAWLVDDHAEPFYKFVVMWGRKFSGFRVAPEDTRWRPWGRTWEDSVEKPGLAGE